MDRKAYTLGQLFEGLLFADDPTCLNGDRVHLSSFPVRCADRDFSAVSVITRMKTTYTITRSLNLLDELFPIVACMGVKRAGWRRAAPTGMRSRQMVRLLRGVTTATVKLLACHQERILLHFQEAGGLAMRSTRYPSRRR